MPEKRRFVLPHIRDDLTVRLSLGYGRTTADAAFVTIEDGRLVEVSLRGRPIAGLHVTWEAAMVRKDAYHWLYNAVRDLYRGDETPCRQVSAPSALASMSLPTLIGIWLRSRRPR